MQKPSVQSSVVLDAIAIIAVCMNSRALAETAIALKILSHDDLSLPSGSLDAKAKYRIAKTLADFPWRVEARAALRDPEVQELAFYFYQLCLRWAPTDSANPTADTDWLLRVRELVARQKPLQVIAATLLDQIPLPDIYLEEPALLIAPQPAAMPNRIPEARPAPRAEPTTPAAPQPATLNTAASSISRPEDVPAALIARLNVVARAKRFVDQFIQHEKAKQARIQEAKEKVMPSVPAVPPDKPSVPIAPPLEMSGPQMETIVPVEQMPQTEGKISQTGTDHVLLNNARNRTVRRHQPWHDRVITKVARSYAMPDSVAISILRDMGRESPIATTTAYIRQGLSPP